MTAATSTPLARFDALLHHAHRLVVENQERDEGDTLIGIVTLLEDVRHVARKIEGHADRSGQIDRLDSLLDSAVRLIAATDEQCSIGTELAHAEAMLTAARHDLEEAREEGTDDRDVRPRRSRAAQVA